MEPSVWFHAQTMVKSLLLHEYHVLVDATNTTPQKRAVWGKIAHQFGIPMTIYSMNTPQDVCVMRNEAFQKLPHSALAFMLQQYREPQDDEGEIIIVNGRGGGE